MKEETSDRALASRAHLRGAYLSALFYRFILSPVIFFFSFFFLQGHWQFTVLFLQQNNGGIKPHECWKKKANGQMLPCKREKKSTSHKLRFPVLLSELWDWTVLSCSVELSSFCVDFMNLFLFYVLCCFFLSFFVEKEKRKKKALYLAHTRLKWILSQESQGSRVPTPRHFNVHFYVWWV